jgi:predicted MFS family arabinose efflux permease
MSIKQTGVPLGGTLAGVLLPILVLHSGWQYAVLQVFFASVLLVVLLLPLVSWLNGPKTSIAAASYRPLEPAKRLVAIPGMPRLLLASMPFSAMQICLRSFFVVYLVKDVGFSLETAGLAFGAAQVGGIVGQIVWATMSDRLLSVQTTMALVGILMTVAALLTAAFTSDWPVQGVVAVAIVYGMTAAGFFPVVLGEVARHAPPGEAGALTGATQLFLVPAAFLGPLVFGAIASSLGYAVAFLSLAACTLAGSAGMVTFRPATVGDASS